MKMKILIAVGALAVVIAAGAAWAQGPHGRHFMMKQMITQRIAKLEDAIQATPQQRAQIEQSRDVIIQAVQAQRQKGHDGHQQLMQALTGEKVDTGALYALANQHAQAIQDLAQVIVPEIVKVHDVLTPAQRATLTAKIQEMRQKHQHAPEGGFGGPGE